MTLLHAVSMWGPETSSNLVVGVDIGATSVYLSLYNVHTIETSINAFGRLLIGKTHKSDT
jgi:hypothetical protein